jgi:hypothetical protein
MCGGAPSSCWLIVVRQDKPALFHALQSAFQTVPQMEGILDRRWRERRREGTPAGDDRRQAPRRRPLTVAELELWDTIGFRLIPRPFSPSTVTVPPASLQSAG